MLSTGYMAGEVIKRLQASSQRLSGVHCKPRTGTILVKSVSLFDLFEVTMVHTHLQFSSP
jgi:hypothetical protein